MGKAKILTVFGTRPQLVKVALLSEAIRKCSVKEGIREVLVDTGQHYDDKMRGKFYEDLGIPSPDYYLNVGDIGPVRQIASIIEGVEGIIRKEKPDMVLVYGDTNSTLAGAIAASKSGITIAHVESGMRSYDKSMPEEVNRVITDHLSGILFCSAEGAVKNLSLERITRNVHNVGDIMYELALKAGQTAKRTSRILEKEKLRPKDYILATIHRQSNTDDKTKLGRIVDAFIRSGEKIIFPVHPRTGKMLEAFLLKKKLYNAPNVRCIEPVGYNDMVMLEMNAKKIVTDSGGVQKESFFFKVPCVTLRDRTEWVETLEGGWNILVDPGTGDISGEMKRSGKLASQKKGLYGNGRTSMKIVKTLIREVKREKKKK